MNIGSGQNAFSVMLNEYSAHGSTNTQQLVINAVSYAYTGQGGKMFVLDLEKKFTEGRENAKPPVGCASHPAFSDVLLLDQAVTCFFTAAQDTDSGMPHTDRVAVLDFYKSYQNGDFPTFLDFKEHVLQLIAAGNLSPRPTYAPLNSVQQQASFGAVDNRPKRFDLQPLSVRENVTHINRVRRGLGNSIFLKHFDAISVKAGSFNGDTYRYDYRKGFIDTSKLTEEDMSSFHRIIYASKNPT